MTLVCSSVHVHVCIYLKACSSTIWPMDYITYTKLLILLPPLPQHFWLLNGSHLTIFLHSTTHPCIEKRKKYQNTRKDMHIAHMSTPCVLLMAASQKLNMSQAGSRFRLSSSGNWLPTQVIRRGSMVQNRQGFNSRAAERYQRDQARTVLLHRLWRMTGLMWSISSHWALHSGAPTLGQWMDHPFLQPAAANLGGQGSEQSIGSYGLGCPPLRVFDLK